MWRGNNPIIKQFRIKIVTERTSFMTSELVSYSPPVEFSIVKGGVNPGIQDDNDSYLQATVSLWESFPEHFRRIGIPMSDSQWAILWSATCLWDRGIKGDKSAMSEANKTFKSFSLTPDQLLLRQISIREDVRAEERARALREKRESMKSMARPDDLTVEVEERKA